MQYNSDKMQARIQEQNIQNLVYANYKYISDSEFEIPQMLPVHIDDLKETPIQSFDYVLREKHPENLGVHFFMWDYKFERIWNYPDRYTDFLKKFKFVLSPDFSVYRDTPNIVQLYNVYRNRWCGRYWQDNGIKVIPTVSFGNPDFFKIFCAGVPTHSTIAVSTMGDGRWGNYKMLKTNWNMMLYYLEPETILLYGRDVIDDLNLEGNIIFKRQISSKVAI